MKTILYIIGLGIFTAWIGFVDFTSIPRPKVESFTSWQLTKEGIIDVNSSKVRCSKEIQDKYIVIELAEKKLKKQIQQAKQIIENDSLIKTSQDDAESY